MAERRRILVVDDEPSIVKILRKQLEISGFEVGTAATGPDGLAQAKAQRPDAIILDLMLPELNGVEVCTRLKQDDATRHIPVLMLTASPQWRDEERAQQCGAQDYLQKPFSLDELLMRVQALLPSDAHPPAAGA